MKKFFENLYKDSIADFFGILKSNLAEEKRMFIVTANPEAVIFSEKDSEVEALLYDCDTTIVPDGVGIVKGAHLLGYKVNERIPGIDVAEKLMELGSELNKSIFLLGSKQEVIDAMLKVIEEKYSGLTVAGAVNGYVDDKDAVLKKAKELEPDIILVALGVPAQEKLIYKHYKEFKKGIFVGVGGSLDVLSGTKARAPKFYIDYELEWLYRILKEPKRIKRFFKSNIKFLFKIIKEKKK